MMPRSSAPELAHFIEGSGIHCVPNDSSLDALREHAVESGLSVSEIECAGANSKQLLLGAIARALRFPAYFGYNWDALLDCLRDLEWLPDASRLIVFRHFDALPHPLASTLTPILIEACHYWKGGNDLCTTLLAADFYDFISLDPSICVHGAQQFLPRGGRT